MFYWNLNAIIRPTNLTAFINMSSCTETVKFDTKTVAVILMLILPALVRSCAFQTPKRRYVLCEDIWHCQSKSKIKVHPIISARA